jgi:hypothetical protein
LTVDRIYTSPENGSNKRTIKSIDARMQVTCEMRQFITLSLLGRLPCFLMMDTGYRHEFVSTASYRDKRERSETYRFFYTNIFP